MVVVAYPSLVLDPYPMDQMVDGTYLSCIFYLSYTFLYLSYTFLYPSYISYP